MKKLLWMPLIALASVMTAGNTAEASYCGAARYSSCPEAACSPSGDFAGCKQQCYTTTRTVQEVVYEKEEYTCYKTVYDTICEEEEITCYKDVVETCYRECRSGPGVPSPFVRHGARRTCPRAWAHALRSRR